MTSSSSPGLISIDEKARKEANLRLLQRSTDRTIYDILASATHVVLYNFNPSSQQWEKSNVEGSWFLAQRQNQSYVLVILNRNSPKNYCMNFTQDFQLQFTDPYLIFKNYENHTTRIRGVWFPNAKERTDMYQILTGVLQVMKQNHHQHHSTPTMSVLTPSTPTSSTTITNTNPETPIDTASATAALLASLKLGGATEGSSSSSSGADQPALPSPLVTATPPPSQHQQRPTPPQSNSRTTTTTTSSTSTGTSSSNSEGATTTLRRQTSPSTQQQQQQPTLDKKSLQLALLSLIQDERFLDLLHAQYLKVHHARTKPNNSNNGNNNNNHHSDRKGG